MGKHRVPWLIGLCAASVVAVSAAAQTVKIGMVNTFTGPGRKLRRASRQGDEALHEDPRLRSAARVES